MKKLLLFLMTLCMALPAMAANFSAENEGVTIYYNITSSTDLTVEVTSGSYAGKVVIPATVKYDGEEYTVTGIGGSAFKSCTELTSIVIGANVTSIGEQAFSGCTALACAIDIPDSVTEIGAYAFKDCTELTSLTLGANVASIGAYAFYNCSALVCDLKIPDSVTTMGDRAFTSCAKLTSLTIGDGLTSIGQYAFESCSSLESIVIGDGVTTISYYAFRYCSALTTLTLGKSVTSVGTYAFYKCSNLLALTIPDSVTEIGTHAFDQCSSMTSLTIGSGVKSIGDQAFGGCTSLTELFIPGSVTTVVAWSFSSCTGLTSVTFGDGVETIEGSAFANCGNITSLTFLSTTPVEYNSAAFSMNKSNCTVYVPAGAEEAYAEAGWDAFTIEEVVIDEDGNVKDLYYDPTVETITATLTYNSATLEGTFTQGTSDIEEYGFEYWADESDKKIAKCEEGETTATLSELEDGTKYNYRAYATTEYRTIYGETLTFTLPTRPTVTTEEATSITNEAATLYGSYISGSATTENEYGFEYWAAGDESDKKTVVGTTVVEYLSTTTIVSATITGLTHDTTYNYRAYATTEYGTTYGEALTFTTASLLDGIVAAIENLQAELTTTWEALQTAYPDVADTFEETYKDIASQLEALLNSAEEAYEAGTLTDEEAEKIEGELATISASITKLLYDVITEKISAVEAELITAWETIESEDADVAEDFTEDYEAILSDISTLTQDIKSAYEAGELTLQTLTTMEESLAAIQEKIATLLTEAAAAEKSYKLSITIAAENDEGVTIYYKITSLDDMTVKVVSGDSEYTGSVTIPETITYKGDTYTVTSIEKSAFDYCTGLTSVIIGDNVTTIGNDAFTRCYSLTSVIIGESVITIGDYAFEACRSLTSITIPASVTTIGYGAFHSCISLTSVIIGENVTTIGDYAFDNCTSLTSITIPASVTSIGGAAFNSCSSLQEFVVEEGNMYYSTDDYGVLFNKDKTTIVCFPAGSSATTYTIPETVTAIGAYAFGYCKLNSLTIGSNVTTIEEYAFYYSYLTEITIPDNVTSIGEYAFSAGYLTTAIIGNGVTSIGSFAFLTCMSLTTITIGSSVTSLGNYVFQTCTKLSTITILCETPPTCGTNIFYGANSTSNITLYVPKGTYDTYSSTSPWSDITNIVESAAVGDKIEVNGIYYNILSSSEVEVTSGDSKYTGSITIPKTINYKGITYDVIGVGYQAFHECTELTSIVIGDNVTYIDNNAFDNCSGLTSIVIGENVTSIGTSAFYGCSSLTEVTIPDGVKSIGAYAFQYCSNLASVTIGENVTTIGTCAFYGCSSIEELTIPDSVTEIEELAFYRCTALETLSIGTGVTKMDDAAFGRCTSLTTAEINCPTVGLQALYNCSALASVTFGENVTTIGEKVFSDCEALTSITSLNPEPPTCQSTTFSGMPTSTCTLYVPVGSAEAYSSATGWSDFTNIVQIDENGDVYDPSVQTIEATDVTYDSATLNGILTAGSGAITEKGFEYWTADDESDKKTAVDTSDAEKVSFMITVSATITELAEATTYNYRAYATTEYGTTYGEAITFTTLNATLFNSIADAIKEVQTALEEAWETIQNDYPDVADTFEETYTDLASQLEALLDSAEEAYEAGTLNEEDVEKFEGELETISPSITDLLAEAKTAENAYLYDVITEKISTVETELTTAWETIESEYADVAEDFKEDYEAILSDLSTLTQDIESAYEDEELTQETLTTVEETLAAIQEKIETLLTEAEEAEDSFQLNDAITAEIEDVQTELEDAWEKIQTDYPDVADNYKDNYESLKDELESLIEELEDAYTSGTLTDEKAEEITTKLEEISQAIADLLTEAEEAEDSLQLNDAITAEIEDVQTELEDAWEKIQTDYPDVADNYKDDYESLKDELESLLEELEDAYNNGTLTDEKAEELITKLEEISQAIADLLTEAENEHGVATGISGLYDFGDDVQVYNLSGARVNTPTKGNVYILRYSDGRTKKVFLK